MKYPSVAYFSMEFALERNIPNYAGGLGVLAADILHSCADMSRPVVGVSLFYHQDDIHPFDASPYMKRREETVFVRIENRDVEIGCYEYTVASSEGTPIPLFLLTTHCPHNEQWDRNIGTFLYPSDQYTRIAQEAILGIGGVRMLRKMGYTDIDVFHMNEGHSAFLTLEMLQENDYEDMEVRKKCTFTTHTPIAAGHDHFEYPCAQKILGDELPWHIRNIATQDRLSMTHLAMNLSRKSNSVSKKHQEVCREMFSGYNFQNITNGIHHLSWVSPHMATLFNTSLPGWRTDPKVFQEAENILTDADVRSAHKKGKKDLITWINQNPEFFPYNTEITPDDLFEEDVLTITFARRFVSYKRPDLIFQNLERLRDIGHKKIQLVFAGRCHADDMFCNKLQERIRDAGRRLRSQIRVVVTSYNIDIAKKLVAGSDVWLNNPIKPREASGTSGMKAALNGVPNLSLADGWWIEGYQQNPRSGWIFGDKSLSARDNHERNQIDSQEIYEILEHVLSDFYHPDTSLWTARMKASISLLSHFTTHRVVEEYFDVMWKEE